MADCKSPSKSGGDDDTHSTKTDFDEGKCGVQFALDCAVFPVPTGVGVARQHNGVVIFAVFGSQFTIGVVADFVVEAPVKPSLVEEHTAHKPNPHCCQHNCCKPVKLTKIEHDCSCNAHPTCVRDSAD